MKEWLAYMDDFCIRTGTWRGGSPVSDAIHDQDVKQAVVAAVP